MELGLRPEAEGLEGLGGVAEQLGQGLGMDLDALEVHAQRELSADEEARLHTMARSIVVKGAASPERLFDETALFLHQVAAVLPAEKKRMLERLHSSDEVLAGRTALVVDDDTRNIFALSSALERHGRVRGLARKDARQAEGIVSIELTEE